MTRTGRTTLGSVVAVELIAAVAATLIIGRPRHLRSLALDSAVIFHGYRALAMFIALYAVTVLVYRSFGGAVATKVGDDRTRMVRQRDWTSSCRADD
jgi:hypothetical protein